MFPQPTQTSRDRDKVIARMAFMAGILPSKDTEFGLKMLQKVALNIPDSTSYRVFHCD
jgi:hypothetical protein